MVHTLQTNWWHNHLTKSVTKLLGIITWRKVSQCSLRDKWLGVTLRTAWTINYPGYDKRRLLTTLIPAFVRSYDSHVVWIKQRQRLITTLIPAFVRSFVRLSETHWHGKLPYHKSQWNVVYVHTLFSRTIIHYLIIRNTLVPHSYASTCF